MSESDRRVNHIQHPQIFSDQSRTIAHCGAIIFVGIRNHPNESDGVGRLYVAEWEMVE